MTRPTYRWHPWMNPEAKLNKFTQSISSIVTLYQYFEECKHCACAWLQEYNVQRNVRCSYVLISRNNVKQHIVRKRYIFPVSWINPLNPGPKYAIQMDNTAVNRRKSWTRVTFFTASVTKHRNKPKRNAFSTKFRCNLTLGGYPANCHHVNITPEKGGCRKIEIRSFLCNFFCDIILPKRLIIRNLGHCLTIQTREDKYILYTTFALGTAVLWRSSPQSSPPPDLVKWL